MKTKKDFISLSNSIPFVVYGFLICMMLLNHIPTASAIFLSVLFSFNLFSQATEIDYVEYKIEELEKKLKEK